MISAIVIFSLAILPVLNVHSQAFNPSILQDSRDLPKTDGRFGFLYRTEDGIAHAAKSEGDGIVHGRYTYSDPTGFKLNFNYNAGNKVTPGHEYNQQPSAPQTNYPTQNQEPIRRLRPPASLKNDVNYNPDYTYQ